MLLSSGWDFFSFFALLFIGVTMDDERSVLPEQIGIPLFTCLLAFFFAAPFLVGDMVILCIFYFFQKRKGK
jgi:hypothetical protein